MESNQGGSLTLIQTFDTIHKTYSIPMQGVPVALGGTVSKDAPVMPHPPWQPTPRGCVFVSSSLYRRGTRGPIENTGGLNPGPPP